MSNIYIYIYIYIYKQSESNTYTKHDFFQTSGFEVGLGPVSPARPYLFVAIKPKRW